MLLEMLAYRKKTFKTIINQMEAKFGKYYYLRDDLKLKGQAPNVLRLKSTKEILGRKVVEVKDYDGIKLICDDESWLMLRASGTEPLVRVYSESKSLVRAQKLLEEGRKLIKSLK